MGLFNFLLGVLAVNAASNTKRNNNQHLSNRQNSNNHDYGGCYDDIECNCDHDGCNYESYDNYDHYDNSYEDYSSDYEASDNYGYCDDEYEDRY